MVCSMHCSLLHSAWQWNATFSLPATHIAPLCILLKVCQNMQQPRLYIGLYYRLEVRLGCVVFILVQYTPKLCKACRLLSNVHLLTCQLLSFRHRYNEFVPTLLLQKVVWISNFTVGRIKVFKGTRWTVQVILVCIVYFRQSEAIEMPNMQLEELYN